MGGDYHSLDSGHEDVFVFRRTLGDETVTVLLNFGEGEHDLSELTAGSPLLSSLNDHPASGAKLRPNEARILLG